MTFTYSSTAETGTATVLHNIRLEIGDTDSTTPLLTDEEIGIYAAARGLTNSSVSSRTASELLVAADICDGLATRYARAYDFETDQQSFKRSQMSAMYTARAKELRNRARGISTQVATRVDGYSDDIEADDVGVSGTNPRRRYYGQEDRIP